MAFIQIQNKYYNDSLIGKLYTIDVEQDGEMETKYFLQYIGGQNVEITQEEYNSLIGE